MRLDLGTVTVVGVDCQHLLHGEVFTKAVRKRRCGLCHSCTSSGTCGSCTACKSSNLPRRCYARSCSRPLPLYRLRAGAACDLPDTTDQLPEVSLNIMEEEAEYKPEEVEVYTVEVREEDGLVGSYRVSSEEEQCILMHENVLQL